MNIGKFISKLEQTGSYKSNTNHEHKLLGNNSLWATLHMYYSILNSVLWSAKLAKKNNYDDKAWIDGSYRILKGAESAGAMISIEGYQNLMAISKPVVFIANHMSLLETTILPCLLLPRGNITFVVKNSLLNYPVFCHILKARHAISISRENPRKDLESVLRRGSDWLNSGNSLIIFPQSTRCSTFVSNNFNSLGVKLARRARVDVLPIAIRSDFLSNGKFLKDFGTVNPRNPIRIAFGEPLCIKRENIHNEVKDFIKNKLISWNVTVQE